tara:strand:- start:15 stop:245 length:231 start_codon:yes stop_codon:yes gene_type:complete
MKKVLVTGSSGFIGFHLIQKLIKNNIKIDKIGFVKGEMLKTHGSNTLLKRNFKKMKFNDIKYGLKKTINFFKKYGN